MNIYTKRQKSSVPSSSQLNARGISLPPDWILLRSGMKSSVTRYLCQFSFIVFNPLLTLLLPMWEDSSHLGSHWSLDAAGSPRVIAGEQSRDHLHVFETPNPYSTTMYGLGPLIQGNIRKYLWKGVKTPRGINLVVYDIQMWDTESIKARSSRCTLSEYPGYIDIQNRQWARAII